jgi:hypothetical protein
MASPTYENPIKSFFRPKDVKSMKPMGIDLGTYEGVSGNADAIYERVAEGSMPCDGAWPADRVSTFKAWVDGGKPRG